MEKWNRLLVFLATALLLMTVIGVVVRLCLFIHHTLLLFSLGILLAYALDPPVEFLRRTPISRSRRVPSREFSVTMVMLCLVLIVGFVIWSLGGHLVAQIGVLQRDWPQYHDRALKTAGEIDLKLAARHINFSLTDTIEHPPKELTAFAENSAHKVLPFIQHTFTNLAESIIVLLISLYFLLYSTELRRSFNESVPPDLRTRADLWETDVNRILGSFVRGQLIIALVIGAAAAVGCLLIGIHLWLIIGLIVVVASLIPVFGPYLGAVPAIIAALIGPTHFHPITAAILVLVYFVVINEVGSKILYPKLVGNALGLHAVLVLFVLFAGLEIDGVIGVLFAAPFTAIVSVTVVHLYRFWQGLPDTLISAQITAAPTPHQEINDPATS